MSKLNRRQSAIDTRADYVDAHVEATRLNDLLNVEFWDRVRATRVRRPFNATAAAAFVADLCDAVADLTRDELEVLERAAFTLRDVGAYQTAHVALYGYDDPYIYEDMGL
jgi:hypothetical protein